MRLFDLHCDTLYECYTKGIDLYSNAVHVDLRRGCRMDAWGQVFAIWIPDEWRGEAAYEHACRALRMARGFERSYSEKLHILQAGESLPTSFPPHTCVGVLAVEGGAALGGKLSHTADLAALGVKIITLTWNGENELGFGAGCDRNAPLKPFGRQAVREMDRLGLLVDVSHLNERGFWDVAETISSPFIASHSLSAAVYDHPRNLTDAQFDEIVRRGGAVGLSFVAAHLGVATFEQVDRHLDHYLSRGGAQSVCFGCDLDGTSIPSGWGGIEVMPRLYDYLSARGYSDACLDALFFENAEKVMRNL
ncbi:MAG: membrane dipeptidase [Clostridia bacterium]|nr:membrane dipeptidase [Clostridia bacterium]